jgi:hypothetical protein
MKKTRTGFVIQGFVALIFLLTPGCSGDDPADPDGVASPADDTAAPSAVADLQVASVDGNAVTLSWTAPGDDGASGTASAYDLRWSASAIEAGNWDTATPAPMKPVPSAAGSSQSIVVMFSDAGTYHFALKTADEVPNWSELSNGVTATVDVGGFVVRQLTNEGLNKDPHVDDGWVVGARKGQSDDDYQIYITNLDASPHVFTRLTDTPGNKANPKNHASERVVWAGKAYDGDDWEIWLYDKHTVPRYSAFTDNDVDDFYPDMANAADFVWRHGDTRYESIRYWRAPELNVWVISDHCCPTTDWSNDYPVADDGTVIWRSNYRPGGLTGRALIWNGTTRDVNDLMGTTSSKEHSIHDGTVAFVEGSNPNLVKYWDGATVHEIGQGSHPALHGGAVAYEAWGGSDADVRFWDGATVHRITDNVYDESRITFDGTYIVWSANIGSGGSQIFYVDVTE